VKRGNRTARILSATVLAAMAVSPLLAAEEAHHNGGAHHPGIGDLLFPTINFALFVWLIWWFAVPAIRGWVRQRHDRVVRALAEAAAAKAEAERLRAEWEERIAHLDQTTEEMRTQARLDAERERERILAAAHRTAEHIHREAERAAANELRRVQQQLRAELVRQALVQAEDGARRQWSAQDQQRALDEFMQQVQR
jgi:F-type H+-transporting ATPase subunit b